MGKVAVNKFRHTKSNGLFVRASSMQSEAHGYASRRAGAISLPHALHLPYVPPSMRLSAASISDRIWAEFSVYEGGRPGAMAANPAPARQ